jgi:hypothetical protein
LRIRSDALSPPRDVWARQAPSNHLAHHALATVEFFRKEMDIFHIASARAVALNPTDGFTLAYLGFLTTYAGDWGAAVRCQQRREA